MRGAVLEREAQFHDALAANLSPAALPPPDADHLELAMFTAAGDVRGRDVLELGCGQGDLTLQLLARGARVTALDISAGMIGVAERRAALFAAGSPVRFAVADAQATGLPEHSFDLVVGKWIVHHLDVGAIARETRRLLRPGGTALFIENQAINPLLRIARQRLAGRVGIPLYGTRDEHPLVQADFDALSRVFPLATNLYPDFCFWQLFDRQVLRNRWPAATVALWRLDLFGARRVPALRRYSYRVIVKLPAETE